MKKTKQPPLGVRPRFFLDEERINELKEAIVRFLTANWPIPDTIISEYNYLTEKLEVEGENNLAEQKKLAEQIRRMWK